MKKLSFFLLLSVLCSGVMAQFPVDQFAGSSSTMKSDRGANRSLMGFVNGIYVDTAAANLTPIKAYPFAQIATSGNNSIYYRDKTATRWILFSQSASNDNFSAVCVGLVPGTGLVTPNSLLTVNVAEAQYCIGGKSYNSAAGTVTLNAAHPTLPRIDAIGVDTFGNRIKVTGVPAINPVEPQVKGTSQLYLTSVLVPAGNSGLTDIYKKAGSDSIFKVINGQVLWAFNDENPDAYMTTTFFPASNYYVLTSRLNRKDTIRINEVGKTFCVGIQSGMVVTWNQLLNFSSSAGTYCIDGKLRSSLGGSVTLAAADPILRRRDVIAADTSGNIIVIKGVPATNPQVPQVNPASQIYLTDVLIQPGATVPTGTQKFIIWDENLGQPQEYVMTSSGLTVNGNYSTASNVYSKTKSTDVQSFTSNDIITYQGLPSYDSENGNLVLKFFIKNKAIIGASANISVQLLNNGVAKTLAKTLTAEQGYSKAITTNFQNISIPLEDFVYDTVTPVINGIRFITTGTGTGFFIDLITMNSGIQQGGDNEQFVINVFKKAGTDSVFHTINGVNIFSFRDTGLTNFTFVDANGISGVVTNSTTTPELTLDLGDITPTTVNGNTITTGTGTITLGSNTLTVTGNGSIQGTNTGDVSLTTNGSGAATIVGQVLNIPTPPAAVPTNLSLGTPTVSTQPILNSNGTGVTLPQFTTTAGLTPGTSPNTTQFLRADGTWAVPPDVVGTPGGGVTSLAPVGSVPNANAGTIDGSVLNLEPASASFGGVVTTLGQTFAGAKTFNNNVTVVPLSTGLTAPTTTGTTRMVISDANGLLSFTNIPSAGVTTLTTTGSGAATLVGQTLNIPTPVPDGANVQSNLGIGTRTLTVLPITNTDGTGVSLPLFSSTESGVVPGSGGGVINYLRADGTWSPVAGDGANIQSNLGLGTRTPSLMPITNTDGTGVTLPLFNTNSGLVPGTASNTTQYLRADGTWVVPPDNDTNTPTNLALGTVTTTTQPVTNSNGTGFTLPVVGTNAGLVPGVASNTTLWFRGDKTWQTLPSSVTNLALGTGTISTQPITNSNGTGFTLPQFTNTIAGLTPGSGGGTTKYLRADGTWVVPPDNDTNTPANLAVGTRTLTALPITNSNGTGFSIPLFSSTLSGAVTGSGGGTVNFLRADGTWAAPPDNTGVTTFSFTNANGVSGVVTNPTTTPNLTISLGNITPTTVNGNTITTGTGTLTLGSNTLTVTGNGSIQGTNTGDITLTTTGTGAATLVGQALNVPTPPAAVATNLALGTATVSTQPVTNSNGTGFTLPQFSTTAGLVPGTASNTTTFLRADGTWATVANPTTANNALTKTGDNIQLGGAFVKNTELTEAFNLSINTGTFTVGATSPLLNSKIYALKTDAGAAGLFQRSGALGADASFGVWGLRTLNSGTSYTNNQVVSGNYGQLEMGTGGAYNFNVPLKYNASGATGIVSLLNSQGNITTTAGGMLSGGAFYMLPGGTANVDRFAAIRAMHPVQNIGQDAYTGTISDYYGLYIDPLNTEFASAITNRYAIYQAGTTDLNMFKGPIQADGLPATSGAYQSVVRNNSTGRLELATIVSSSPESTTANNALTMTGSNIQLGGALIKNTYITDNFHLAQQDGSLSVGTANPQGSAQLTVVKDDFGMGAYVSKSGFPQAGESSISVYGSRTVGGGTYGTTALILGLYGELGFNGGDFTFNGAAPTYYTGLAGLNGVTTMYTGAGNLTAGNTMFSGGSYYINVAGAGNVDRFAAVRALNPIQTPGAPAYTGTILNHYGIYIDPSDKSGFNITNKYAIYQEGVNDLNLFKGPIKADGLPATTGAYQSVVRNNSTGRLELATITGGGGNPYVSQYLLPSGDGFVLVHLDGLQDTTLFIQPEAGMSSFAFTNANGISGTVTNPTTTPNLTLSLGAITPTSVAATGAVTGSNLSGTNTGDITLTTTGSGAATLVGQTLNIPTPAPGSGSKWTDVGTGNIYRNSRVGIGSTADPVNQLDVTGNLGLTGIINLGGTLAAPLALISAPNNYTARFQSGNATTTTLDVRSSGTTSTGSGGITWSATGGDVGSFSFNGASGPAGVQFQNSFGLKQRSDYARYFKLQSTADDITTHDAFVVDYASYNNPVTTFYPGSTGEVRINGLNEHNILFAGPNGKINQVQSGFGSFFWHMNNNNLNVGYNTVSSINATHSVAFGQNNTLATGGGFTAGFNNTVAGTAQNISGGWALGQTGTVSGSYAATSGQNLFARSLGEHAFGIFGTDYTITAGGANAWNATDRLFSLGNGTATNARSNALTILKNGTTTFSTLAGSGDRMVVANSDGTISTQAIPSGSGSGSKWTDVGAGNIYRNSKIRVGSTTDPVATIDAAGNIAADYTFSGSAIPTGGFNSALTGYTTQNGTATTNGYVFGVNGVTKVNGGTGQNGYNYAGLNGQLSLIANSHTNNPGFPWAGTISTIEMGSGSTADLLVGNLVRTSMYDASSITNYYQSYLETPALFGGSTITNLYGVYQQAPTAKNIFAGGTTIGSTTNPHANAALDVYGQIFLNGNRLIQQGPGSIVIANGNHDYYTFSIDNTYINSQSNENFLLESFNGTDYMTMTHGIVTFPSALDTDGAAPTQSGTVRMVTTDGTGKLSFQAIPSGGAGGGGDAYLANTQTFTGINTFTQNVLIGNTTDASTTTPKYISLGAEYGRTAVATQPALKVRIYDNGTNNGSYGFGMAGSSLDYYVPGTSRHEFYEATDLILKLEREGLTLPFYATGLTPPATTGTTRMMVVDANGLLSHAAIPSGGAGGDMYKADNLSGLANYATARTNLGGTTVGSNMFTSTNPNSIAFAKANSDNTVTWRGANDTRLDIGAEASLGNPAVSGYVLTSTAAGVRSWVPDQTGGAGGGVTTVGAISGTGTATGASITGSTLNLHAATGTTGGVIIDGAQSFPTGTKTFKSGVVVDGDFYGDQLQIKGLNGLKMGFGTDGVMSFYNSAGQIAAYAGLGIGTYNGTALTLGSASYGDAIKLPGTNNTVQMPSLDTDATAPGTTGTVRMVTTDGTGTLSFQAIPSGGGGSNWTITGSDIYRSSKVNIGSASAPTNTLDVAGTIGVTGEAYFTNNVFGSTRFTLGSVVDLNTTTPPYYSAGGAYGRNAGTPVLKFRLYDNGTNNGSYGLGMGGSSIDYYVPGGASHEFYVAGTAAMSVNVNRVAINSLDTDGGAPTQSGTIRMVTTDASGILGFQAIPSGGGGNVQSNLSTSVNSTTVTINNSDGTGATIPQFTSGNAGVVPNSGGGTTNFLRADGQWTQPPSGGGADGNNFPTTVSLSTNGTITIERSGTTSISSAAASGTWGINITGNAATITNQANSATITSSVATTGNQIVLRDASGDINSRYSNASYFNSSDDISTGAITHMMAKFGDNYFRSATASKVKDFLVTTSGGGTTNFLRADGTWAAPPAGGGGVAAISNIGTGADIYSGMSGSTAQLKRIDQRADGKGGVLAYGTGNQVVVANNAYDHYAAQGVVTFSTTIAQVVEFPLPSGGVQSGVIEFTAVGLESNGDPLLKTGFAHYSWGGSSLTTGNIYYTTSVNGQSGLSSNVSIAQGTGNTVRLSITGQSGKNIDWKIVYKHVIVEFLQ